MMEVSKKAQAQFQFIAKYPSAILILGGILMILLNKTNWALFLIGLGAFLHILWLR